MADLIDRQAAFDEMDGVAVVFLEAQKLGLPNHMDGMWFKADQVLIALEQLPSAQPEQQWIPCSERLPDGRLNKSYLVQDKDGRRAVGTYTNWGWMFGHYMNDPVAWMPLPEPYREKYNERT